MSDCYTTMPNFTLDQIKLHSPAFQIGNSVYNPSTSPEEEDLLVAENEEPAKLIVFNDDINTFDHVIHTLVEICQHTAEQAEQCALIIHNNGKCCVKIGNWDKLAMMRNAICNRGIQAEIGD